MGSCPYEEEGRNSPSLAPQGEAARAKRVRNRRRLCAQRKILLPPRVQRAGWDGCLGNAIEGAFGATTCTRDSFREVEVQSQYCAGGKTLDNEWIAMKAAKNLPRRSVEIASSSGKSCRLQGRFNVEHRRQSTTEMDCRRVAQQFRCSPEVDEIYGDS